MSALFILYARAYFASLSLDYCCSISLTESIATVILSAMMPMVRSLLPLVTCFISSSGVACGAGVGSIDSHYFACFMRLSTMRRLNNCCRQAPKVADLQHLVPFINPRLPTVALYLNSSHLVHIFSTYPTSFQCFIVHVMDAKRDSYAAQSLRSIRSLLFDTFI